MEPINRLSELIEDWKYFIEVKSFKMSLALILTDIAKLPYRHLRFDIYARSLDEPFPDLQAKIPLSIRPFKQDDLAWVRVLDRPSEARLCSRRLEQGDEGLAAFWEGRPAGYAWGSTDSETKLEKVHLHLRPGDVFFTDAFTPHAYRGQGIQTALTLARFNFFRESGCHRAVSFIDIHNGPSLAVWQRKLNSHIIGRIDFMRIGSWYRIRYS